MKILHVIDKLTMDGVNPSSCTVLLGGWSQALQDDDCSFSVLSLAREEGAGAYLRERGVDVRFADCGKHSWGNVRAIRRAIEETGAGLVHLHGYGAAHFGRIAARQAGVPNVVHEHAILSKKPLHVLLDWLLRNRTDVAVAVSDAVRSFMVDVRKVPPDRIRIIGNGIDLSRFRPASESDRADARARLGLTAQAGIVGTVTRFRSEKGNEFLLRAFADVVRSVPGAELVVVGDGPLGPDLRSLVASLGIDRAVHWLGHRADVDRILPAFDVHVIPSLTEGFPLALAEGMAVGNAMVVTAVGGMRELAVDRVNALVVPPSDAAAIAQAVVTLLRDRGLAGRLGVEAVKAARAMDIGSSAARLRGLYCEMLGQTP